MNGNRSEIVTIRSVLTIYDLDGRYEVTSYAFRFNNVLMIFLNKIFSKNEFPFI